jgi:hypothetical protein
MIASFLSLQSSNDGTIKTVSVYAQEDATGGAETIHFQIIDQFKSVEVRFAPNEGQMVTVTHTAAGQGLVTVTAVNSPAKASAILNVEPQFGEGRMERTEKKSYRW